MPDSKQKGSTLAVKAWLIGSVVATTLIAAIQQVRDPDSAAWIVAAIGVLFIVLFYFLSRLAKSNYDSANSNKSET